MTPTTIGYDTTPSARILHWMRSQNWTVQRALSELVDNSFGPARGNADRVDIYFNPRTRTITVIDDGHGMDAIGKLFRLGDGIPPRPDDIGAYGNGGTWAVLWLGDHVKVETLRNGLVSKDSVDWPEQIRKAQFPIISNAWVKATPTNTDPRLWALGHGTLIEMKVPKGRYVPVPSVTRDLSETYAPGFRMGKEIYWVTERPGSEERRRLQDLLEVSQAMIKAVDIENLEIPNGFRISGRIGIIPDLSHAKSHIKVAFGYRVIQTTRDCFRSWALDEDEPTESRKYTGTGVAGYIELGPGWQHFLEGTKSGFRDEQVWRLLMNVVFVQIEELLKETAEDSFTMEFMDMEFNLERALEGLSRLIGPATKGLGSGAGRHGGDGGGGGGDNNGNGPGPNPGTQQESPQPNSSEEEEKPLPARSNVKLIEQTDEQMGHGLCRVSIEEAAITVEVNEDHQDIKIALEQKPVNRLALYLLITAHLAREMVAQERYLRKLLRPSMVNELRELDETNRISRLQAMLMDQAVLERGGE